MTVIPVALNGFLRGGVVVLGRVSIAVEDGKFGIVHDIRVWMGLDALPYPLQLRLQDGFGGGVVGAIGVILDHA